MGRRNDDALRGAAGFSRYYGELFSERWQPLHDALRKEPLFLSVRFAAGAPYFLDAASVCAALCLPLAHAATVLDLCAAPGGKTLVLAGNLRPDAVLYSNERSSERKQRLDRVVSQHLPPPLAARVLTSCRDGARWCRQEQNAFDAILLDAPCSSERHVLGDSTHLERWSPARIKSLAMEQWALLSSAWRLLKEGGFLLYATCALAPQENDGVIARLQKKFPQATVQGLERMKAIYAEQRARFAGQIGLPPSLDLDSVMDAAEKTDYGVQVLPDAAHGAGPLYFSLVSKEA